MNAFESFRIAALPWVLLLLSGVGRIVTAKLLAEASHLIAERDYHALRAHAAVAPVTRQSRKRTAVLNAVWLQRSTPRRTLPLVTR